MSKEITLNVRIDKNGQLHVKPDGTQNEECLDIMEFLQHIPGVSVVETQRIDTEKPGSPKVHERQST